MFTRHRLILPAAAVVLFGLGACGSTPAAAPAPVAPTSAAAPAAPPSAAPTSAAPASAAPEASVRATAGTAEPSRVAGPPACPSAKDLEKVADLPAGWRFDPASVECWKGWATADPQGPAEGDGVYLFRHRAGAGWKFHSEGSGYHCEDLGITEAAPFCQYP